MKKEEEKLFQIEEFATLANAVNTKVPSKIIEGTFLYNHSYTI